MTYSNIKTHNWNHLNQLKLVIKGIGMENRLKIFGNIRYFNDRASGYLSSRTNSNGLKINQLVDRETHKNSYFSSLMETQIQLIALTVLDMKDNDRSWP